MTAGSLEAPDADTGFFPLDAVTRRKIEPTLASTLASGSNLHQSLIRTKDEFSNQGHPVEHIIHSIDNNGCILVPYSESPYNLTDRGGSEPQTQPLTIGIRAKQSPQQLWRSFRGLSRKKVNLKTEKLILHSTVHTRALDAYRVAAAGTRS